MVGLQINLIPFTHATWCASAEGVRAIGPNERTAIKTLLEFLEQQEPYNG